MKKYLIVLCCSISMVSCESGIQKDKLITIENIALGYSNANFNGQLDSLQIPHKRFFNKILMMNYNDLMDNKNYYSSYYTTLFNFTDYRNNKNSIEHIGLIAPVTLEGTNNNFALIVLLCHTVQPWLWGDAERYKSTVTEKFVRQEVNNDVVNRVFQMYVDKYGQPQSIDTSVYNTFWVIDGNSISKMSDNTKYAVTYKWETEYYSITLFSGMDFYGIYGENGYVESTNSYIGNIGEERANIYNNEMNCKAFPYIYYQLNEKALKELKIDSKKL